MKSTLTLICAGLLCAGSAFAGGGKDSLAVEYAKTITAVELQNHLKVLASDEYEGRETGKKGQKMAAEYIANYFKGLGLPPVLGDSYYQEIPMRLLDPSSVNIKTPVKEYKFLEDFYFFPGQFDDQVIEVDEIIFAGYGINTDKYNDFAGLDVKGKMLMVFDQEPFSKKGKSLLSGEDKISAWSWNWRLKIEEAEKQGATGLLIVVKDIDKRLKRIKGWLKSPGLELVKEEAGDAGFPIFYISEGMASELMAATKKRPEKLRSYISKKGRTINFPIPGKVTLNIKRKETLMQSENVLGYIEGTDLKDELIVITAHYDHLGMREGKIYNGADDDGSGTVAVLELAEAFAEAKKNGHGPRRSVLIMPVSGEEKGLLGSQWYVENPVFPLEKTVADLNIDMIGRKDKKHDENENYIYLIGSDKLSTELHNISEHANSEHVQLTLDYTFNDPEDPNRFYYRSDHYNFAKNNIPVIFYFSGTHEDYHKPSDTVDKINFPKMERVTKLVFHTAWELANRDKRIIVDIVPEKEKED